jgi:choice-of-anchor B domain-containing protein
MRFAFIFIFIYNAILSNAQSDLQLLGHLNLDSVTLAGCWHYVDDSGGEYALVGTSKGLSIVDISQPAIPVQRFKVPGIVNTWREVKTWGGFAYVGSEASGSGITIVDLRSLPDTIYWKVWKGDTAHVDFVVRSHTVQAEAGYLYIFGSGPSTNGAVICDLVDPWNPKIVGEYTKNYVHDGFIRGDTLWTSEIYVGQFGVVNIANRADPQLIITNPTPAAFNHNSNLSDDSKVLFTTDEKAGAPLAAFDVSDLQNITLLDTYYPSYKPTAEVHNVRVLGNFLINPSYGGQLTIVDATRPSNLVETERALLGTSLVWDADPYLPSGIIFATARNEGLFIYQPKYKRAAYLEGKITDLTTGLPITGAKIEISALSIQDSSLADGIYKTGTDTSGVFSITFSHPFYQSKVMNQVALQSGQITQLDIGLSASVQVIEVEEPATFEIYPTIFGESLQFKTSKINTQGLCFVLLDALGCPVFTKVISNVEQLVALPGLLPNGTYVGKVIDNHKTVLYQTTMFKLN